MPHHFCMVEAVCSSAGTAPITTYFVTSVRYSSGDFAASADVISIASAPLSACVMACRERVSTIAYWEVAPLYGSIRRLSTNYTITLHFTFLLGEGTQIAGMVRFSLSRRALQDIRASSAHSYWDDLDA